MATEQSAEPGRDGLIFEIIRHLVRTAVYTPLFYIGLAAVTFPFATIILTTPNSPFAKYIALVYASWAIVFGQFTARDSELQNYDEDWSKITCFVIDVVTILYYWIVVFMTTVFAFIAMRFGMSEVAVAIALLLPAGDIYLAAGYGHGLGAVMLDAAEWVGKRLTDAWERIPAREIVVTTASIIASLSDALPPVLARLSLISVNYPPGRGRQMGGE